MLLQIVLHLLEPVVFFLFAGNQHANGGARAHNQRTTTFGGSPEDAATMQIIRWTNAMPAVVFGRSRLETPWQFAGDPS